MAFTDFKTLKDTAKLIQTKLVDLAPVRTGNLRDRLRTKNTINSILGDTKASKAKSTTKKYSVDASFQIEYAPAGAMYGKWWNDPTLSRTIKRGKTRNIPRSINFAQNAIDSAIEQMLPKIEDELAEEIADDIIDELQDIVDNE